MSAKLTIAALTAALLLANAIASAPARNFEFSAQNIRVTWSKMEYHIGEGIQRCAFTLEGSLHSRSISKVAGALVGAITRASGCGTPRSFPWHLTYESFTGTLPFITSVRLLLSRFLIQQSGVLGSCNYGTSTDNLSFSANPNPSGEIAEVKPVEGRNVYHLLEGSVLSCDSARTIVSGAGDGPAVQLNTTIRLRVTLI
jgi:hypothetical protein